MTEVNVKEIQWGRSEWNDHPEALMGWLDGIEIDIHPSTFEEGQWAWSVKPTSSRCEFPELFNCGDAATPAECKKVAEESARRADASYQHINYG